MANDYPFRINGYVYSKGTKKGFLRMARMGIPRPPFAIENQIYSLLKKQVHATAVKMLRDFKNEAQMNGLCFKDGKLVTDSAENAEDTLESLMDFFDEMGRQETARNKFINEMQINAAGTNLKERWAQEADMNDELSDDEESDLTMALNQFFKKDQIKVVEKLKKDADEKHLRASFSLDKEKIFEDHMEALRKLYIDNSIQRIRGEQNAMKRAFLQRLTAYATGETENLEIADLMREIVRLGDGMARMFARDQMARFNKAVTLSQFRSAGVTKVKWVTSHDVRVRKSHKELDGKIFDVNHLPAELDDYNCRCGLVPAEYSD